MSVLVAVADRGVTYIGCDGRMVGGDEICSSNVRKWLEVVPGLWVGIAGSYRALTLLQHRGAEVAESFSTSRESNGTPEEMAFRIGELVRDLLHGDGWIDKADDGKARWLEIELLIALPGRIFESSGTGGIAEKTGVAAIGSGSGFALGALDALLPVLPLQAGRGADRVKRIAQAVAAALDVASRRSSSCGGEFFMREVAD